LWQTLGAFCLLASLTILAVWRRKKQPFMVVGWLWFLITLVPVIGLVQVGVQSMADRYTYIPFTGLFMAFSWSLYGLSKRILHGRLLLVLVPALCLPALAMIAKTQVSHWRNSRTLFQHALRLDPGNHVALNNLAVLLGAEGRSEEAIKHYLRSLDINPRQPDVYTNLGNRSFHLGRLADAEKYYGQALELDPDSVVAHFRLANLYAWQGYGEKAARLYRRVLDLAPNHSGALDRLKTLEGAGSQPD
jgi:tetratricopeptide (TPR) repeat protein